MEDNRREMNNKLGKFKINKIYCMDCVEGMKSLPNESIDIVVTSPPYDSIRDYKGFSIDLHKTGIETFRILRSPAASMSVIENLIKLIELIVNPFDDEAPWVKFERGPWKGKWKGSKYMINSIGTLAPIKQTKRLLDMETQLSWFDN